MITDRPFRWYDPSYGEKIENFLETLCLALPGIAIDILKIGFGDLRSWYNDPNPDADYFERTPRQEMWKVAKCGCLVGTFAAQSRDKAVGCIELVETHPAAFERDMNYGALGGGMVLYMAIAAATKRDIHAHGDVAQDPLYNLIVDVGGNVAEECDRGEWVTTDDEGYAGYETDDLDADDRTQELGQYMLDYMRAILTGMGFTKLPTSPKLPCTF
jgi:hypothetical protein